ncbi:MAG: CBS domain-containing protein, partial [Gemmatimonadales bacterium]
MTGWILTGLGALAATLGVTVAVSVTTVNKRELARLVSQQLRGFRVASRILSTHGSTLEASSMLASLGVIVAGLGVAAALKELTVGLTSAAVLLIAVPAVVGLTYAVPRAVGRRWPDRFAGGLARALDGSLGRLAGLYAATERDRDEEFAEILKSGGAEELFEPKEFRVISGVLSFNKKPVRELMKPRPDVVAVQEGTPLKEVARLFAESGYSRLPVFRDSLDNVIGMTHAFDLLKVKAGGELPLRRVAIAPGSKACADMLYEMQKDRHHMAIVLDEYGGMDGIVTMDDLLKELVGRLFSDQSERVPSSVDIPPRIEVEADAPLDSITQRFGLPGNDNGDTAGAMLIRAAGRIPRVGERFLLIGMEFE